MTIFQKVVQIYKSVPLVLQIIQGLLLGVVLAYFFPTEASWVEVFGEIFVKALKSVAPLLVLVLVTTAIASHASGVKTGLRKLLSLYLVSTLVAAGLAVCASFLFPVTLTLPEEATQSEIHVVSSISEVLLNIIVGAVTNPVQALIDANYIAILLWAVALGFTFRKANQATKDVLSDFSTVVTEIVKIVIRFAPLGVMGLVFTSCTSEGGFSNLTQYVKIIVLLVSVMLIVALVVNPIFVAIVTRRNPFTLVWICLRDSAYYACFTRSSAANIPVNLNLCDKMDVPRAISSISIPLGATVNMAGAAITISILTLSAAFTIIGPDKIDMGTAVLLCIVSAVSACGASGVAGGSLMLIPLACSLFGIDNNIAMQVVGKGMVIGVIQDSCETALNSSTDALFTIAISQRMKEKHDFAQIRNP